MQHLFTLLLICITCTISAQVTLIPDPNFEEVLINLDIDSDGEINGQVLTSDIEGITELDLDVYMWLGIDPLTDLTGLEDFINLEKLSIYLPEITTLNVSHNTKLKELTCIGGLLTNIDVSSNLLLEKLNVGNESDLGPVNQITVLDLSNNPNIRVVNAAFVRSLNILNLKNIINPDMVIDVSLPYPDEDPSSIFNHVCIQVDDEEAAQNNEAPYSGWTLYDTYTEVNFSESCALGSPEFEIENQLSLYPNPVNNSFTISGTKNVNAISIYNCLGQKVKEAPASGNEVTVDVSSLAAGSYFVSIATDSGVVTKKLMKR